MADIYLYDVIGEDWLTGEGMSAKKFQKSLADLNKTTDINLFVDSPGGDAFDGLSIYNQIKRHQGRVTAHIDGLAASAASVIIMAADEIVAAENSVIMIHKAWSIALGANADDLRKLAENLDVLDDALVDTYVARTGQDRVRVVDMMAAETWMSAAEAEELGFADSVDGNKKAEAYADVRPFIRAGEAMSNMLEHEPGSERRRAAFSRTPKRVLAHPRHGTREEHRLRHQRMVLNNIQARRRA